MENIDQVDGTSKEDEKITDKQAALRYNYADSKYAKQNLNDYERYCINSIVDNDRPKLENCLKSKKPRTDCLINAYGVSLLHYACGKRDLPSYQRETGGMIGLLIRYGFNPLLKDDENLTPLDYAKRKHYFKTVTWIENFLEKHPDKFKSE